MRIPRPEILSEICSTEPVESLPEVRANLACGHWRHLGIVEEGQIALIRSGVSRKGRWERWEGTLVQIGDKVPCISCSTTCWREQILAAPPEPLIVYPTEKALLAAHPGAPDSRYGIVYKYGEKRCVQVYQGQHEWTTFNVDDPREAWDDPGWIGVALGFAFVPDDLFEYLSVLGVKEEIEPPFRDGYKPATYDLMLFGDRDKITEYLGADDPLLRS